ncbi:GLPGLI family protein [Flavobacteriales bacterium]|nr:GLPGLI family protein [Flavobacteriales bacterium]
MKKLSLIFLSLICITSFSQNVEGEITFIESLDMTEKIEEMNEGMDSMKKSNPERAAMMSGRTKYIEEFMKSFERTETVLYFKNNETIYKEKPAVLTESEVNQESNYMMAFKPKADIIYYNKDENKNYIQKDFMGSEFLVKQPLNDYKWKIVMEQKIIKGYPCMKAVKEDSLFIVEAWFSSQIPVSSGPKGLYGLPGMILEAKFIKIKKEEKVKKKGGRRMMMMQDYAMDIIITADVIELKEVNNKLVKAPNKGTVVESEAAYNKLIMDKVKEWQKGGGRGRGGRH